MGVFRGGTIKQTMRQYTVVTKEISNKNIESIQCDICGVLAKYPYREWADSSYCIDEITIMHRYGVSYPEGGSTTECSFDVCPSCFTSTLMLWLAQHGAQPTIQESDW